VVEAGVVVALVVVGATVVGVVVVVGASVVDGVLAGDGVVVTGQSVARCGQQSPSVSQKLSHQHVWSSDKSWSQRPRHDLSGLTVELVDGAGVVEEVVAAVEVVVGGGAKPEQAGL
jgi:hypothetical protein